MAKKIIIRTSDVTSFFDRAKNAAQRADQGGEFNGATTLSFEDPQRMLALVGNPPIFSSVQK